MQKILCTQFITFLLIIKDWAKLICKCEINKHFAEKYHVLILLEIFLCVTKTLRSVKSVMPIIQFNFFNQLKNCKWVAILIPNILNRKFSQTSHVLFH